MRLLVSVLLIAVLAGCGDDAGPTGVAAPRVVMTAPADSAVVRGTIAVQASAERASRVRFFIDGAEIGFDEVAPFVVLWSSQSVADGAHVLRAEATGSGGTASDSIRVSVRNVETGVTVTVVPASAVVELGTTRAFVARVSGAADTSVTWSVEGGDPYGIVDTAGVYTAPATRPDPGTAVVRATSTADPTRSGTATVTLTVPGGLTVTREALLLMFDAGTEAARVADELLTEAVELAFVATGANAGVLTLTGTLTENALDPSGFAWSAEPADRLLVRFGGTTIAIRFDAFDGALDGGAPAFLNEHRDLELAMAWSGFADLAIRSRGGPADSAGVPADAIAFDRSIAGMLFIDGETREVDLAHRGVRIGGSATDDAWTIDETVLGSIGIPEGTIAIDAARSYRFSSAGGFLAETTRTSNGSLVAGEDVWAYDAARVRTVFLDNRIVEASGWSATGSLVKNGTVVAALRFDGPVANGAVYPGPGLELAFEDGSTLPLAPARRLSPAARRR